MWFVLVPVAFGLWLSSEIDAQYTAGVRVTSDSDSLSIPIGLAILLNAVFLLLVNVGFGVFVLIRRAWRSRAGRT